MTTTAEQKKERWARYTRFGATGIINTAADFLTFNLLIIAFGSDMKTATHAIFKAAAFAVAATNSYFLNKHWVFKHKGEGRGDSFGEGGRFLAVSIAGFFVNVAVSTAAFQILERSTSIHAQLAANIGAAIGSLLTLVSNYAGYKSFVFNKKPHELHKEHTALGGDTGIQRIEANPSNAR